MRDSINRDSDKLIGKMLNESSFNNSPEINRNIMQPTTVLEIVDELCSFNCKDLKGLPYEQLFAEFEPIERYFFQASHCKDLIKKDRNCKYDDTKKAVRLKENYRKNLESSSEYLKYLNIIEKLSVEDLELQYIHCFLISKQKEKQIKESQNDSKEEMKLRLESIRANKAYRLILCRYNELTGKSTPVAIYKEYGIVAIDV